jgi:hypothetical protein
MVAKVATDLKRMQRF